MGQLSRAGFHAEWQSWDDVTTTVNTYADVGTWEAIRHTTRTIHFTATDNPLLVQVLGSLDNGATYDVEAEAPFVVTTSAAVSRQIGGAYTQLKVQVKPNVNDAHGTLSTKMLGVS